MKKFIHNKQILLVIAVILCLSISIPGTLGFIVTKTETVINTFVPFKALLGDVIITKEVEHPLGENYEIPEDIYFDFRVDLGSFYADTVVKTSEGEVKANANGSIIVSVRPGESVGIRELDEGTEVAIMELAGDRDGFALTNGNGKVVIVPSSGYREAKFINAYTPQAADLNLSWNLTKTISGREWLETDSFTFRVASYDGSSDTWTDLGTGTVDQSHTTISLNALVAGESYDAVGSYQYRITEDVGSVEDVRYDSVAQYITVNVTDRDMDGYLEVGSVDTTVGSLVSYDENADLFTVESHFINVYEGPSLNMVDHYGYIVGYPVDYRDNSPTDDESLWPVVPEGEMTRAEAATIFFRLLSDESRNRYWSKENVYTDVDSDDWYNNAVSTLTNAGILYGYVDGSYCPNARVTRAELTAMASRFFRAEFSGTEDYFNDIAGHWAREEINKAAEKGIVHGYGDGTFRPDNYITRAEAMTLINSTIGRKPHKDHLHSNMRVWPDNMATTKWYYAQIQEATNSHEYEMVGSGENAYEEWVNILPMRDWVQLEREWSDANDGKNGEGEVVQ